MEMPGDPPSPFEPGEPRQPLPGQDFLPAPPPSPGPPTAPPTPTSVVVPPAPETAVRPPALDESKVIFVPVAQPPEQPDTGYGLVRHLTSDDAITERAIRLGWNLTGMLCVSILVVALASTSLLLVPHFRLAGIFGMSATVIASMGGVTWRWKRRQRRED